MKIEIFIFISLLNLLFIAAVLINLRNYLKEIKDDKTKIEYVYREVPIAAKFIPIKDFRPQEGSHIFVWDVLDRKAIPAIYQGNQEIWEAAKDKEKRFTHFVEMQIPIL